MVKDVVKRYHLRIVPRDQLHVLQVYHNNNRLVTWVTHVHFKDLEDIIHLAVWKEAHFLYLEQHTKDIDHNKTCNQIFILCHHKENIPARLLEFTSTITINQNKMTDFYNTYYLIIV